MQDRFKFRFFDVETKKMYDVKNICFDGEPTVTLTYKPVYKRPIYTGYLIQSTGLKDKNGKLIFGGDIIKEKWYSREDEKYRECLYSVEYDKEKMAYCFVEVENGFKNFFIDMEYIQDDYEVIGNIYENKELLGGVNE